jgi:YD repeat-containing protein
VAAKTDPKGQRITYSYDQEGRLIKKTYPAGSPVTYTYDSLGNRLTMTDSLGTTRYQYDLNGNVTSVKDLFGHSAEKSATCMTEPQNERVWPLLSARLTMNMTRPAE